MEPFTFSVGYGKGRLSAQRFRPALGFATPAAYKEAICERG